MAPSSRFASSLKPNVAYLDLTGSSCVAAETFPCAQSGLWTVNVTERKEHQRGSADKRQTRCAAEARF
jgi:hypothetical protein